MELLANVNGAADAVDGVYAGAVGVGLYRTEYLFLTHPSVPDEEEQLAAYRAVIEAAPQQAPSPFARSISAATSTCPTSASSSETNPFMGLRSIRLSSAYPEFFQTQLRAILRAGQYGKVSLLFPDDQHAGRSAAAQEAWSSKRMRGLQRRGVAHFDDDMPLGIMLEVPAAALCIEAAAGRGRFRQHRLERPDPVPDGGRPRQSQGGAPVRAVQPGGAALAATRSSRPATRCNKPVTLCGEMAGRPRCFLPLFGMGLRRLSMSPAFVPSIKELLRNTTLEAAQTIARRVLQMHTFHEIRGYLTTKVQQIWPSVTLLDVRK